MRKVSLSLFVPDAPTDKLQWLVDSVKEIERASLDADMIDIVNAFKIVNAPSTPVRTLDVATATVGDIAAFLATFIADLQRGGTNRVSI